MQILLLNTNPVVSRLITLCLKDRHAELYEFSSLEEIEDRAYDLAFIDDASYKHIALDTFKKLHIATLVLLTSHPETRDASVDIVIKKPFLPSKIIEVIDAQGTTKVSEVSEDETPHIFPLSPAEETPPDTDEEENEESVTSREILDINEIDKIKSLLEMDEETPEDEQPERDEEELERLKREVIRQNLIDEGIDIIEEEEVIGAVAKDLTLHLTYDTQHTEEEKEAFETKLLDAMREMKIKKLKKLLKGAEVTISIKFKDGENA